MKKKILISIMLAIIIIAFTLSAKPKEETKTEYQNEQNNQFADDPIDREKNKMPKKLINAILPDDYPKELDELFDFYYEIYVNFEASKSYDFLEYREFQKNVFNNLSKRKIGKLYYLHRLANNAINGYYSEYIKINGFVSVWYDNIKVDKASFISNSMRLYNRKRYHQKGYTDIPGGPYLILSAINKAFANKTSEDNWFEYNSAKLILRGKIKELCISENPEIYLITIDIFDTIGGFYDQKEIQLIVPIYSEQNNYIKKTAQELIQEGNESIFFVSDYYYYDTKKKSVELNDMKHDLNHEFILCASSIIPIENNVINPIYKWQKDFIKKDNCTYNDFKVRFENDIKEFLEKIGEE